MKTPDMLKHMIQLNMRITNKSSNMPTGFMGLSKPDASQLGSQFGTFKQLSVSPTLD